MSPAILPGPRRGAVALRALLVAILVLATVAAASARAAAPVALERTNLLPIETEIISLLPGGDTLVATNGQGVRFIDVTDPDHPVAEPFSVPANGSVTTAVPTKDGRFVLVGTRVGTAHPNDWVVVIDVAERRAVHRIPVPHGPDSLAVAPSGDYAAVAIEADQSDNPGSVAVLDIRDADPTEWMVRDVPIPEDHPALAEGSGKPQPEFVDINGSDVAAVTLQENNAIAIVDLRTATLGKVFSMGHRTVTAEDIAAGRHGVDTDDNESISLTEPFDSPREPDAVQWTADGSALAVVDEGEGQGGRSWSIWRPDGELVRSVDDYEHQHALRGMYHDDRSDNNGAAPEGMEVATIGRREFAFVASERFFTVAMYDITDEADPVLIDIAQTGVEPEGIVADPAKGAVYTADEEEGISTLRIRGSEAELAPDRHRLISRDAAWANAAGLADGGGGALLFSGRYRPGLIHRIPVTQGPVLRMRSLAEVPDDVPSNTIFGDVARDPATGWIWGLAARNNNPSSVPTAGYALTAFGASGGVRRRIETLPYSGGEARGGHGLAIGRDGRYAYVALNRMLLRHDLGDGTTVQLNVSATGLPDNNYRLQDLALLPDGRLAWIMGRGDRRQPAWIDAIDTALFDQLDPGATIPADAVARVLDLDPADTHAVRGPTALAVMGNGDVWVANDADKGGDVGLRRYPRAAARVPRPLMPGSELPSSTPTVDVPLMLGGFGTAKMTVDGDRALVNLGRAGQIMPRQQGPLHVLDARTGDLRDLPLPAFEREDGSAAVVHAVISDGVGGAVVGGEFDTVGGEAHRNVARILPDGTVDEAFTLQADGAVRGLHVDAGRLYLGGLFRSLGRSGEPAVDRAGVARVALATGAPDDWAPALGLTATGAGYIDQFAQDGTTLYLAGPGLQTIDGVASARIGAVATTNGARLPFTPSGIGGTVSDVAVLDGDVFVASTPAPYLRRYEPDGTLVPSFDPGLTNTVSSLVPVDGSLWAMGGFYMGNTTGEDGSPVPLPTIGLVKLDPDTGLYDRAIRDALVRGGSGGQDGRIAYVDGRIVAAGRVGVRPPDRSGAQGFGILDAATGEVTPSRTGLSTTDSRHLAAFGDGDVIVAGSATSFAGPPTQSMLVELDVASGAQHPGWRHGADLEPDNFGAPLLEAHDGEVYLTGPAGDLDGQRFGRFHRFDARTGAVDRGFDVRETGPVMDVAVTDDRVYLVGTFIGLGGRIRSRIGAVDRRTGEVVLNFVANANAGAEMTAVEVAADGTIWVAGRALETINGTAVHGLARLDPETGDVLPGAPRLAPDGPGTYVDGIVSHAPSGRLVVWGAFAGLGDVTAPRLAFVDPESGTVVAPDTHPGATVTGASAGAQGALVFGRLRPGGDEWRGVLAYDPVTGELDPHFRPALESASWAGFVGDEVVVLGQPGGADPFTRYLTYRVTAPRSLAPPVIEGTAAEGETVTCRPGRFDGAPTNLRYTWLRDGAPIEGATEAAYELAEADAGRQIACRVTGENSKGEGTSEPSEPIEPAAGTWPKVSQPPEISGVAAEGETLACSTGSWRNAPTAYGYAWERDGVPIPGAQAAAYEVIAADDGADLRCRVTASNEAGEASALSAPVHPAAKPVNVTAPRIIGAVQVGREARCDTGAWLGEPTLTVRWLRGGAPIAGATGPTYTPGAADAGTALVCEVQAARGAATSVARSAARTVAAGAPPASSPPRAVGDAPRPASPRPAGAVAAPRPEADPLAPIAELLAVRSPRLTRLGTLPARAGDVYGRGKRARIRRARRSTRLPVVLRVGEAVTLGYRAVARSRSGRAVRFTVKPRTLQPGVRRLTVRLPARAVRALARGGKLVLRPQVGRRTGPKLVVRVRGRAGTR